MPTRKKKSWTITRIKLEPTALLSRKMCSPVTNYNYRTWKVVSIVVMVALKAIHWTNLVFVSSRFNTEHTRVATCIVYRTPHETTIWKSFIHWFSHHQARLTCLGESQLSFYPIEIQEKLYFLGCFVDPVLGNSDQISFDNRNSKMEARSLYFDTEDDRRSSSNQIILHVSCNLWK